MFNWLVGYLLVSQIRLIVSLIGYLFNWLIIVLTSLLGFLYTERELVVLDTLVLVLLVLFFYVLPSLPFRHLSLKGRERAWETLMVSCMSEHYQIPSHFQGEG